MLQIKGAPRGCAASGDFRFGLMGNVGLRLYRTTASTDVDGNGTVQAPVAAGQAIVHDAGVGPR